MPYAIIVVAAALVIAVGLFVARVKWIKNETSKRLVTISHHLQDLGVKVSLLTKGDLRPRIETRDFWKYHSRSEYILEIKEKGINYIFTDCITSENTTIYYLNFVVISTNWVATNTRKATRLVKKRSFPIFGKVSDLEWKGDQTLANLLNNDYSLKAQLLKSPDINKLTCNPVIYPRPDYEYYKIRIRYFLPTGNFFEVLNVIGSHLRFQS